MIPINIPPVAEPNPSNHYPLIHKYILQHILLHYIFYYHHIFIMMKNGCAGEKNKGRFAPKNTNRPEKKKNVKTC